MSLYSLFRPLLFQLDAEKAHHLTLNALQLAKYSHLPYGVDYASPVDVMGIHFQNPVGLAAGLDKNGDYIDALAKLGFGALEIGTVTPRPQPGNPKPRLFRLPQANAIINRMGFNNKGVDYLIAQVKKAHYKGVLGINIGKNFDTPIEKAADDYLFCLRKVYQYAQYITINISSPNTQNLRKLQDQAALDDLLRQLKNEQTVLTEQFGFIVPLVLKIAPDLDNQQIDEIAQLLRKYQFEAVIATNTTLARDAVLGLPHAQEAGGLSGAPVFEQSTHVVRELHKHLANEVPIIAAGGILSGEDAKQKLDAGASLVQIYSGLIYKGPDLLKDCARVIG